MDLETGGKVEHAFEYKNQVTIEHKELSDNEGDKSTVKVSHDAKIGEKLESICNAEEGTSNTRDDDPTELLVEMYEMDKSGNVEVSQNMEFVAESNNICDPGQGIGTLEDDSHTAVTDTSPKVNAPIVDPIESAGNKDVTIHVKEEAHVELADSALRQVDEFCMNVTTTLEENSGVAKFCVDKADKSTSEVSQDVKEMEESNNILSTDIAEPSMNYTAAKDYQKSVKMKSSSEWAELVSKKIDEINIKNGQCTKGKTDWKSVSKKDHVESWSKLVAKKINEINMENVQHTEGTDKGQTVQSGTDTNMVPSGRDTNMVPSGRDTNMVPSGRDTNMVPSGRDTNMVPSGRDTNMVPLGRDTNVDLASSGLQSVSWRDREAEQPVCRRREGIIKPFICRICHKLFSRQDSLKRHMSSHTRQRSKQCGLRHSNHFKAAKQLVSTGPKSATDSIVSNVNCETTPSLPATWETSSIDGDKLALQSKYDSLVGLDDSTVANKHEQMISETSTGPEQVITDMEENVITGSMSKQEVSDMEQADGENCLSSGKTINDGISDKHNEGKEEVQDVNIELNQATCDSAVEEIQQNLMASHKAIETLAHGTSDAWCEPNQSKSSVSDRNIQCDAVLPNSHPRSEHCADLKVNKVSEKHDTVDLSQEEDTVAAFQEHSCMKSETVSSSDVKNIDRTSEIDASKISCQSPIMAQSPPLSSMANISTVESSISESNIPIDNSNLEGICRQSIRKGTEENVLQAVAVSTSVHKMSPSHMEKEIGEKGDIDSVKRKFISRAENEMHEHGSSEELCNNTGQEHSGIEISENSDTQNDLNKVKSNCANDEQVKWDLIRRIGDKDRDVLNVNLTEVDCHSVLEKVPDTATDCHTKLDTTSGNRLESHRNVKDALLKLKTSIKSTVKDLRLSETAGNSTVCVQPEMKISQKKRFENPFEVNENIMQRSCNDKTGELSYISPEEFSKAIKSKLKTRLQSNAKQLDRMSQKTFGSSDAGNSTMSCTDTVKTYINHPGRPTLQLARKKPSFENPFEFNETSDVDVVTSRVDVVTSSVDGDSEDLIMLPDPPKQIIEISDSEDDSEDIGDKTADNNVPEEQEENGVLFSGRSSAFLRKVITQSLISTPSENLSSPSMASRLSVNTAEPIPIGIHVNMANKGADKVNNANTEGNAARHQRNIHTNGFQCSGQTRNAVLASILRPGSARKYVKTGAPRIPLVESSASGNFPGFRQQPTVMEMLKHRKTQQEELDRQEQEPVPQPQQNTPPSQNPKELSISINGKTYTGNSWEDLMGAAKLYSVKNWHKSETVKQMISAKNTVTSASTSVEANPRHNARIYGKDPGKSEVVVNGQRIAGKSRKELNEKVKNQVEYLLMQDDVNRVLADLKQKIETEKHTPSTALSDPQFTERTKSANKKLAVTVPFFGSKVFVGDTYLEVMEDIRAYMKSRKIPENAGIAALTLGQIAESNATAAGVSNLQKDVDDSDAMSSLATELDVLRREKADLGTLENTQKQADPGSCNKSDFQNKTICSLSGIRAAGQRMPSSHTASANITQALRSKLIKGGATLPRLLPKPPVHVIVSTLLPTPIQSSSTNLPSNGIPNVTPFFRVRTPCVVMPSSTTVNLPTDSTSVPKQKGSSDGRSSNASLRQRPGDERAAPTDDPVTAIDSDDSEDNDIETFEIGHTITGDMIEPTVKSKLYHRLVAAAVTDIAIKKSHECERKRKQRILSSLDKCIKRHKSGPGSTEMRTDSNAMAQGIAYAAACSRSNAMAQGIANAMAPRFPSAAARIMINNLESEKEDGNSASGQNNRESEGAGNACDNEDGYDSDKEFIRRNRKKKCNATKSCYIVLEDIIAVINKGVISEKDLYSVCENRCRQRALKRKFNCTY